MGMVENMAKGFVQGLEKDVKAIDPEHTGHGALPDALDSVKQGEELLKPIVAKIDFKAVAERLFPELTPADIVILVKAAGLLFKGLKLVFEIAVELYKKRFA